MQTRMVMQTHQEAVHLASLVSCMVCSAALAAEFKAPGYLVNHPLTMVCLFGPPSFGNTDVWMHSMLFPKWIQNFVEEGTFVSEFSYNITAPPSIQTVQVKIVRQSEDMAINGKANNSDAIEGKMSEPTE